MVVFVRQFVCCAFLIVKRLGSVVLMFLLAHLVSDRPCYTDHLPLQ